MESLLAYTLCLFLFACYWIFFGLGLCNCCVTTSETRVPGYFTSISHNLDRRIVITQVNPYRDLEPRALRVHIGSNFVQIYISLFLCLLSATLFPFLELSQPLLGCLFSDNGRSRSTFWASDRGRALRLMFQWLGQWREGCIRKACGLVTIFYRFHLTTIAT